MNNVYMGLDVEEFIFGEGTTYEENIENVTDEEMNEFGVIECVEDPDVACYRIALENEQNYNAIMTAMLTREYQVLESTGKEMVYEASAIKGFLDRVHEMVQRFWAKVKGVFKKVMDNINSIVLSNKGFVKKYRALGDIAAPDHSFTGYKFDKKKMVINYGAAADKVKGVAADKIDEMLNEVRGIMCGGGKVSADAFAKTLKDGIYGGNTVEVKVASLGSFQSLLNNLENAAEQKKIAKDSHKEAEKAVKKFLSEVKEARSKAESGSAAEKEAKAKADAISKSLTIMSTALSVQTRAIVASAVQDRKAANAYVRFQNSTKTAKTESAVEELDVVLI